MISVLMSVFNENVEWVSLATESILNQTYTDFEFIIIIDNPNLPSDIKSFLFASADQDSRIRLIYNEKNLGLATSLNIGISIANGEYIARMDADDISFPNRLEKELSYIQKNDLDMVTAYKIEINEDGEEIGRDSIVPRNPNKTLVYSNYLVHPLVLVKTEVLRELEGYRPLLNSEDLDLWLRMIDKGYRIGIIDDYYLYYRIRSNSASVERQLEQYYTTKYIVKLKKEREQSGTDSFSLLNQKQYLAGKDFSEKNKNKFKLANDNYKNAFISFNKKKYILVIKYLVAAFVCKPAFVSEKLYNNIISRSKNAS